LLTQTAFAAGPPPIVRVYVAGPPEAVSGARDAVQELCARSNVAVVVRDAAGADEALLSTAHAPGLAEAYFDLRPGAPPRVVVVDGESRQDLERRNLPEDASLEISIETMAHVVCSAIESSLAARAAAPPPKAREPERKPRAFPSERWEARASLFASAANFGAGFRGGAGLALGLNYGRAALHFGGFFSVAGFPASDVEAAGGLASFGLLGVRAVPTLEWQASDSVVAFAGLGAGADWVRITSQRPPPGTSGGAPGTSVDPIAAGMLGLRLRIGRGVAALLAFDADVELVRHRYVIQTPEGSQSFFEAARVRPVALAGFSVALDGDAPNGAEP
jgi:hypothetical protein